MRVALISDIHGNLVALDAVLLDIERRGADRIVCLGDVAASGPQPVEALRRVRTLGCPVVMGNTDDLLRHPPRPGAEVNETVKVRDDIARWAAGLLSPEDRRFLDAFRPTVEIDLGTGASLLCFHGSPRSFDHVLLPTTPEDEVLSRLDGTAAAVLAGGHTHVAMVRPLGARLLVNPGSVGLTFFRVPTPITAAPPWAEYGVVTWASGLADVELRRVPLNRDVLIDTAHQSGMPHSDWWIAGWG